MLTIQNIEPSASRQPPSLWHQTVCLRSQSAYCIGHFTQWVKPMEYECYIWCRICISESMGWWFSNIKSIAGGFAYSVPLKRGGLTIVSPYSPHYRRKYSHWFVHFIQIIAWKNKHFHISSPIYLFLNPTGICTLPLLAPVCFRKKNNNCKVTLLYFTMVFKCKTVVFFICAGEQSSKQLKCCDLVIRDHDSVLMGKLGL